MIFSLKVMENTGTSLRLGRSKFWRFLFLGIGLFLILGSILIREAPLLFIIITLVCILAGLYDDRWFFDREKKILFHRGGIGPINRKKEFPLDAIDRVVLRSAVSSGFTSEKIGASKAPSFPDLFRRGRATLWLLFKDDTPRFLIDEGSHRDRGELENIGTTISAWCHVPFEGPGEEIEASSEED